MFLIFLKPKKNCIKHVNDVNDRASTEDLNELDQIEMPIYDTKEDQYNASDISEDSLKLQLRPPQKSLMRNTTNFLTVK